MPCFDTSPRLTRLMSGSSYYEAEVEDAISVTYGELNERVRQLEEDLRTKENQIAQRDQVIQQLRMRPQADPWGEVVSCSSKQKTETNRSRNKRREMYQQYSRTNYGKPSFSQQEFLVEQNPEDENLDLWGQGNPPWDSFREQEVQQFCQKGKMDWSDLTKPEFNKTFDKVERFEVDFPPIVLKNQQL